jgi:23S rRNA pseudouridine1911/1915/1917 synthase
MNKPNQLIELSATIPPEHAGKRLDQAVALLFPDYSRSRLQQWIRDGMLTVNGKLGKAKDSVQGHEIIHIQAQPTVQQNWQAQALPLTIVFEDEHLLVINKPAGLVVHPAAGNLDNTLVNAVLHHAPELAVLPRAGIVHRLDKDTTGLLVIAKTLPAHTYLTTALQQRDIAREYECVVNGTLISGGTIDEPIGRHAHDRLKQAVISSGKHAITHYRILTRFRRHTHLHVKLETGRTHQIRVHMSHIHHPIVGDITYGGRVLLPPQASTIVIETLRQFKRQALHAKRLALQHPITHQLMTWEAPLPADLQTLIDVLKQDNDNDIPDY